MFRASSTILRLESSKIFGVVAHARLRRDVYTKRDASRCRFNVSTAYRGGRDDIQTT
jgi:hypothetical protein